MATDKRFPHVVTARVPESWAEPIAREAERLGMFQSEWFRTLIRNALPTLPKPQGR